MPTMQLLMLGAGAILTLIILALAFAGPSTGKAQVRRLDVVKNRHSESIAVTMESQLRRISAKRNSTLDGLAKRFIPNPVLLNQRLAKTGKSWSLAQYGMVSVGLVVIIITLALIKGAPIYLGIMAGLAIGLMLPHMVVSSLISRRIAAFNARFPDGIDLMVRGLRSGLPISETLGIVSTEVADPVGIEFRGVADRIRIGKTMEASLQESADKIGTPEFQFFCITLAIQRETGGNLAETLSNLGEVLRKRASMKLKIRAMSSESKASAYIIGALPFIVFTLIYFVNPEYMGKFFIDERLMMIGAGGFVWMGIGAFILSRMISFEI
jgi:tight adherence protein B